MALRKGGHGCDFVQVRYEEAAAFTASARAKYSGVSRSASVLLVGEAC